MRGQKRPVAERGTAVGIALMTSGAEAARITGIPERTIQQWMSSAEFAELRATPREEVGEAMWVAILESVYELQKGVKNPKAYLRDKVAAFDSLVTKRALIMGEATSREETKDITSDIPDHIKRELRERYAVAVRGSADAVEGESPQEPAAT